MARAAAVPPFRSAASRLNRRETLAGRDTEEPDPAHIGSGFSRTSENIVLAERERERLHASVEELDLELSIDDRPRLSDQLI
jgi:hypothetical protein